MITRPLKPLLLVAVAFVAVGMAFTYLSFHHDLESARSRVSSSKLVNTPCGVIEYAVEGKGVPVLLVHGAGGGFDQGLDLGKALIPGGFQVIAMSRFGYLRTPLPSDASAEAQADAHACLLDALNIPQAAIVGASAGAPSAIQFALRHPDRCASLALVVPAGFVPRDAGAPSLKTPPGTEFLFDSALRMDFLFWIGPKIAPNMFIEAILATPKDVANRASPEEQRRIQEVLEHILPIRERRLGLLNDAKVTKSLPRYPLEAIRVPTLTLSIGDDLYGTYDVARYTAEHVRGARFVGYETGGHLWVGHHREVVAELIRFLRGEDR